MRRLGTFAAVLALSLVTACGDDEAADRELDLDKNPSSAGPSGSTSVPADPAANLPEGMKQPEAPTSQANTMASARAFTGYALELMHYSFATREIAHLRGIVAEWADCSSCKEDAASIKELTREGEAQIPNKLPQADQTYVTDRSSDRPSLVTTFKMPAGNRVNDAGKVVDPIPSVRGTLNVDLAWSPQKTQWLLKDYDLVYGG